MLIVTCEPLFKNQKAKYLVDPGISKYLVDLLIKLEIKL